ncbi:hypothetical protein FJZ53_02335 [Candidatus Woesearchaeota archaeon]|nr:hypothetical protein [Candidatus Woesearchaeota archaeon]
MDKIKMIKKGSLIAIGLASITSRKAEQMVDALVKQGKITRKQGEDLARKVLSETMREQHKIRKHMVGEVSKSAIRVMGVAKQEANRLVQQMKQTKSEPSLKKKTKKKKR